MVSDHLSDFVTRIRNGYSARNSSVEAPNTKLVMGVAKVLVEEGFLKDMKIEKNLLSVKLNYSNHQPAVTGILRVSKSGARIYSGISDLPKVLGGLGMCILSTPKGILSGKKAKKLNTGGEVLLKVW